MQKISYYKIAEYPQRPSLNTHQMVCFISSIDPNTIYAHIFLPIEGKLRDISPFVTHIQINNDIELITEAIKNIQKDKIDHSRMNYPNNKKISKLVSENKKSPLDMLDPNGDWKIQIAKNFKENLIFENIIHTPFQA